MKAKASQITAKDYLKVVEWSEADGCFVGSAPPLIGQCCHGSDDSKVYKELCRIVDEWIAIHQKDGRPLPPPSASKDYSGRFIVRMPPELHKSLALRAVAQGESLNNYVVKRLQPSGL